VAVCTLRLSLDSSGARGQHKVFFNFLWRRLLFMFTARAQKVV